MCLRIMIPLLFFALIMGPIETRASLLQEVIRSVNASVLNASKSINKAHNEVRKAVANASSGSAMNDVLMAQTAIKEVEDKQKEVETRFAELATVSAKVESEKEALQKEKSALEARVQIFSMGFYTTLTTTLVAILGLVVKFPTSKLEKKLMLLEIQEKQMAIREREARIRGSPN